MRIIALEGPSYAGKTTAITALARSSPGAVTFDCYVKGLPLGSVPRVRTRTRDEQIAAFEMFMEVEASRVERLAELASSKHAPQLVILDRSVDTLLAHAYALDTLYHLGARKEISERVERMPHLIPNLTLYLHADEQTLSQRRAASGARGAYFLHDPRFLHAWRSYFTTGPVISRHLENIRADQPAHRVAREIRTVSCPGS
jgi:thymidylate kinase